MVHSQMMLVRTEMGAHKTYGQFRGAKEILEMLGLDPEEAADAKTLAILEELKWTGVLTREIRAARVMTRVLTREIKTKRVVTRVAAVLKSDPRFDPRERTLFAVTQVTLFARVNACFFIRAIACFLPEVCCGGVKFLSHFQNDFCLQWNR